MAKKELDDPGGKKNELVVYVFNAVEDEWSFIKSVASDEERLDLIADTEDATDSYFVSMATEPDFIYISPKTIPRKFQAYAKELLRYKSTEVMVPTMRTHLICRDFIADKGLLLSLVSKAKQYKQVTLLSYCASFQFFELKRKLQSFGLTVNTPEAPKMDCAWTVNFFGSKSGIRQLAQKSAAVEPDFIMPEGLICVGKYDAAKIAANRFLKQKGVVIKTNKGSGGNGVFIYRDGQLPTDYESCEKEILADFDGDRYWEEFPIVIEDLVSVNTSLSGGYPNVEFKIHKNGRIEMLYVCACMVTEEGMFYGLDICETLINDRMQTRIEDTGYYIAEQYSAAGYRGHFDVDMCFGKNGHIYVLESNTRNTGGTDVYKTARKLLGKDFMYDHYVFSRSRRHLFRKSKYSFTKILKLLKPYLYSLRRKEGLIISSANSISKGKLIYAVIAKNKKRAYKLEEMVLNTLV